MHFGQQLFYVEVTLERLAPVQATQLPKAKEWTRVARSQVVDAGEQKIDRFKDMVEQMEWAVKLNINRLRGLAGKLA